MHAQIIDILIIPIAIIVHELGHWMMAKYYRVPVKWDLSWQRISLTTMATDWQGIVICVAGMAAGFIPIAVTYQYMENITIIFYIFLLTMGCGTDIKQILKSLNSIIHKSINTNTLN